MDLDDEPELFKNLKIPLEVKKELFNQCKMILSPKPVKIRAEFDLKCFAYNGIDAI